VVSHKKIRLRENGLKNVLKLSTSQQKIKRKHKVFSTDKIVMGYGTEIHNHCDLNNEAKSIQTNFL